MDGSKFRACNSKKNNFNEKNLSRKIKYIDEKIQKYISETDENDNCEETSRKPDVEEIKEKIRELKKRKEIVVDERTKNNKELYKRRQIIVEHPFGTLKRGWSFSYFKTKGLESVKTEASLAFLAYNIKRVTNILGIKGIMERLVLKRLSEDVTNFVYE